jgi:RNA polymerase sigma factor (sigma-70 family)
MITEDLTADIFERAYRQLDSYDPIRGAFSTWITRIAHNYVSDYLDREARRDRHEVVADDDLENLPSADRSPEAQVVVKEAVQRLLVCLERLTARDRQIVSLRFAFGMRNKEVADLLDVKEHTLSVIVLRALERLRACQEER